MSGDEKEPTTGGTKDDRPEWLRAVYSPGDAMHPDDRVMASLSVKVSGTGNNKKSEVIKNHHNTFTILENDARWEGKIRFNEFSNRIEIDGHNHKDAHLCEVAMWIFRNYAFEPVMNMTHEAIRAVAQRHPFHPVRDYLNGLEWDGVSRLDTMLHRHLGAPDTHLNGVLGVRWAISCVARAMKPGCKVDTVMILVGKQGVKKSTWLNKLCSDPEWFSDSQIDMRTKDAYQTIQGKWIYEFPEMCSTRKSDNNSVKAFLSSRVDTFRPSYGRETVSLPRQLVFVGSTNDAEFLTDPTGARRYWPVEVEAIDLDLVEAERDQLWAEAVQFYRQGEQWWLADEEIEDLEVQLERYYQGDPWEEIIADYLIGKPECTIAELLVEALDKPKGSLHRGHLMQVGSILRRLSWKKARVQSGGKRTWVWTRDE